VNRLPRKRDPNRDKAFLIFQKHEGSITNRAIAEELDVLEKTISAWKSRDKWVAQLSGKVCSTTKKKRSTTKKESGAINIRNEKRQQVVDALVEAGTYSPALDLLIEIYLDAYEDYARDRSEKLRKELAKYLGQLGLDGKNKDLIKKSGVLLEKSKEEPLEEKPAEESNKLLQFRQRMSK
jgi:Phage terminase small subunit